MGRRRWLQTCYWQCHDGVKSEPDFLDQMTPFYQALSPRGIDARDVLGRGPPAGCKDLVLLRRNGIVVDPMTRIEGHLRIEAEVADGVVSDAWSSSTMFRGIELILQGRDPRDAWVFAQRICGVCTTVHAIASIRAVENAIGARPPGNARLLMTAWAATTSALEGQDARWCSVWGTCCAPMTGSASSRYTDFGGAT